MTRLRISVSRRHGVETSFDLEDEELLFRGSLGRFLEVAFGEELDLKRSTAFAVLD